MAADCLAFYIIRKAQPIILDWWSGKTTRIDDLVKLKSWYWKETVKWLGNHESKLRHLLSKAFMDFLDWKNECHLVSLCLRFIIQAIFCCDVGHLEKVSECKVAAANCAVLGNLLRIIGPFYFSGLHDTCLSFAEVTPITALIESAPYLKNVHFFFNYNSHVLKFLRDCCRKLEIFKIDLENLYCGESGTLEQDLFRAFFGNLTKNEVLKNLENREKVQLSFNRLKKVCIRYDAYPENILKFLHCLQHFYPDLQIEVTSMIAVPFDKLEKKIPLLSPTFATKNENVVLKKMKVYIRGGNLIDWEDVESRYDVLHLSTEFCSGVHWIQERMSHLEFDTLKYIYFTGVKGNISPRIECTGSILQELYIYGPILESQDEKNLVKSLNECPNLKVLCLLVNVGYLPALGGLKPLKNLDILLVGFTSFLPFNVFEASDDRDIVKFMSCMLKAAPDLRMLQIPGRKSLSQLINLGMLSRLRTLSILQSSFQASELRCDLDRLPNLALLIFNGEIEYNKYLKLKNSLRRSSLEVIFKKDRLVYPYTF